MKISRNSPCPCGSGKKYKRCCADKDLANSPQESSGLNDRVDIIDEDDSFDEDDRIDVGRMMLRAFTGMRKMLLERKPHIKQYTSIRSLHSDIMDAMMEYYEQGKFKQTTKPGVDIPELLDKNPIKIVDISFDPETNEGSHGIAEILFYPSIHGKTCITDDFIDKKRYRKPDKVEFLHDMLSSRSGLFEVTETDLSEAYVTLRNVFTGEEYKIVDIGLSGSPNRNSIYLYSRIITHQGVSFNAGLNLIFSKSDPFIKEYIRRHKENYQPLGELTRFLELYNKYSKDADKINPLITRF